MNYLSAEQLTKSYGDRLLFGDITFHLDKGQKTAIVARNGLGKSTLLKILAGKEVPDSGTVSTRKDIVIGYLPQNPDLDERQTVMGAVFYSQNPVIQAIKNYEDILLHAPDDKNRMEAVFRQMDSLQAWDFEARVKQIMGKLQIHQFDKKIGELSGGQQKRVALARVLINDPDLLILDEPTNHLDLDMIEWLEDYLSQPNLSLLMVTHDRYFLERVCNQIIELEDEIIYKHKGNYSYYLEKKEQREEIQQTTKERAQGLMKKELEWIRRQPKARGTKAKARVDAFDDIKERAGKKVSRDELKLNVKTERLGGKILELHRIKKSYGDLKLIDGFDYKFKHGEKVGIIGRNGTGKSTFLNILADRIEPDSGKVVTGETVVMGYYRQEGMALKDDMRMIEAVREVADFIPMWGGKTLSAAQLLERFLFPRDTHYTPISKLSGGEKRRLYLLTILMQNPNFLILDEPTNDLDVLTLNVLEDFLQQYPGCVIIVSHDRYFMDKVVDHLFVFEGNGVVSDFPGNYSQYRDRLALEEAQKRAETSPIENKAKQESPSKEKTKLSYKEKLEFERLEGEIEELEQKKEELTQQLGSGETQDHEKLLQLSDELNRVVTDLDTKSNRWLELSEYV